MSPFIKIAAVSFPFFFLNSDPPDAPNTPRVHEVTASTARISWHEPKDNGSPILGYWIERKEVNSKHWTRVNRALLSSLDVKVTGLMEGLTYIFRVCAENLAGPGPFSEPSDRIVAMDAIRKFPWTLKGQGGLVKGRQQILLSCVRDKPFQVK